MSSYMNRKYLIIAYVHLILITRREYILLLNISLYQVPPYPTTDLIVIPKGFSLWSISTENPNAISVFFIFLTNFSHANDSYFSNFVHFVSWLSDCKLFASLFFFSIITGPVLINIMTQSIIRWRSIKFLFEIKVHALFQEGVIEI